MEATPPPQQPGGYGTPPPGQPAAPGQSPYPTVPSGGKLDTAGTFERIFQLYGSQFPILLGTALIIFVPVALLNGAVAKNGNVGLAIVAAVIGLIGQALFTGAVVEAVRDMRDGRRDFGIGDLFSSAAPFILPLILGGIVFGIGFVIGLILIIIPGLIFLPWYCVFAPAIVVERQGVFGSFQRSRDLVRGNGWRVFGVLVVTFIVTAVISNVVQQIALNISDNYVGGLVGS